MTTQTSDWAPSYLANHFLKEADRFLAERYPPIGRSSYSPQASAETSELALWAENLSETDFLPF